VSWCVLFYKEITITCEIGLDSDIVFVIVEDRKSLSGGPKRAIYMEQNALAIEIEGLSRRFGKVRAVRDLNMKVPCGSVCGWCVIYNMLLCVEKLLFGLYL